VRFSNVSMSLPSIPRLGSSGPLNCLAPRRGRCGRHRYVVCEVEDSSPTATVVAAPVCGLRSESGRGYARFRRLAPVAAEVENRDNEPQAPNLRLWIDARGVIACDHDPTAGASISIDERRWAGPDHDSGGIGPPHGWLYKGSICARHLDRR